MIWKSITLYFVFLMLSHSSSKKHKSRLCISRSSYKKNCSHQMNLKHAECSARIDINNTECWDMAFPSKSNIQHSGRHLRLQMYCYDYSNILVRPVLNASFISGDWKEGVFRVTVKRRNFVVCVKFSHTARKTDNFELFYDCIWHGDDLFGEEMELEYFTKHWNDGVIETGTFQFVMQQCLEVNKLKSTSDFLRNQSFIYVEEIIPGYTRVHIQKTFLNNEITHYFLKKCHTCKLEKQMDNYCSKHYCTTEKALNMNQDGDEFITTVTSDSYENCYYLAVEAVCYNCTKSSWCEARSVLLPANPLNIPSAAFITVLVCIILLAGLLSSCFIKHRLSGKNTNGYPIVLFVYNPVHTLHKKIILNIKKLLEMNCGVKILFDETEMESSVQKDPFIWYGWAVSQATHIAVIATPTCAYGADTIYEAFYPNALRILKEKLKNEPSRTNVFNISFPYHLNTVIPVETKHFKCFQLMKHFNEMVLFIHADASYMNYFSKIIKRRMSRKMKWETAPIFFELCKQIENMKTILSLEKPTAFAEESDTDSGLPIKGIEASISEHACCVETHVHKARRDKENFILYNSQEINEGSSYTKAPTLQITDNNNYYHQDINELDLSGDMHQTTPKRAFTGSLHDLLL